MIPLAVLAAELNENSTDTAQRVGEQIHTDSASGVRMVPAHICRELLAARQQQLAAQAQAARAQAEHQAAQREQLAAAHAAEDQARQARAERHREILRGSPDLSALEVMLAADANPDRRTPGGCLFDGLIAAERREDWGFGCRLTPTEE